MSQTASKRSEPAEKRYSAKAEINTFMRRFLAHVNQENAKARDKHPLRGSDNVINHSDLNCALEKLDSFLSHFDIARIKIVQLEIAVESSRRSYDEEIRSYSSAIDEWEKVCNDLKNETHNLMVKIELMRFIPSRKVLSVRKEKRIRNSLAFRRRLDAR